MKNSGLSFDPNYFKAKKEVCKNWNWVLTTN
jgi:hypothetical protein